MKNKGYELVKKYAIITLGAVIYAIGIALFLDPNSLAPGGTTGIAIIINFVTHIKTGTLVMIINIPIMLFGWWRFGTKFIFSTVYATYLASFIMNIMQIKIVEIYGAVTTDRLLAGIIGGALLAVGMGLIFKQGATTGGTDIIVKAMRQKIPHLKTGVMFILSDSAIITISAIVFHNIETALYAGIAVVVTNFVLDMVLYKNDGAKLIYIISNESDKIANRIMEELDIGVTALKGEGAYTKEKKKVLMIVSRNINYTKIREIVREEDEDAFLIVSGASEVFGYGYKNHFMQEI